MVSVKVVGKRVGATWVAALVVVGLVAMVVVCVVKCVGVVICVWLICEWFVSFTVCVFFWVVSGLGGWGALFLFWRVVLWCASLWLVRVGGGV